MTLVLNPNEELEDTFTRHRIDALRYSKSVFTELEKDISSSDEEVQGLILASLIGVSLRSPSGIKKIKTLQKRIKEKRKLLWENIDKKFIAAVQEFQDLERDFYPKAIKENSPVKINLNKAERLPLKDITFEGSTLKEWLALSASSDLRRINNSLNISMSRDESVETAVGRIRGSSVKRNVNSLVRTAIISTSDKIQLNTYGESDVFENEIYVATLDARTTPICRALDGKVFKVNEGSRPPLHFNCRSVRVPYYSKEMIGNRPFNPTTETLLLNEFTSRNNLTAVTSRANLPRGYKGKFDDFARKETRRAVATVPSRVTYEQWFSRQSKDFQEDVLGPTRFKLYASGKLTLDKFVNRQGDELTIKELRKRHNL